MSEDKAWNKFYKTGKILDYLVYSYIKNSRNKALKGANLYATQNRRFNNNGKANI